MPRLECIWTKRARKGPMDPHENATLVAEEGLVDCAQRGTPRQVTVISLERWAEASAELGVEVDPVSRRANLLVSGVDLVESAGKVLRIGACRLRLRGETKPCALMDKMQPGLQAALRERWGGGAWGDVLDDGEVAVGDEVRWETDG